MNIPPLPSFAPPPKLHRLSVWQLVISVIGLVMSLLSLFGLVVLVLIANSDATFASVDTNQLSKLVWVVLLGVLITIPSIVFAIRRLSGKESRPVTITGKSLLIASLLTLVWLGCLWAGSNADKWALASSLVSWLNIATIALPFVLWLTIGRYKLAVGSQQRSWGLINTSVFLSAMLIILLEVIVVAVVAIVGISSLVQNADMLPYMQLFQSQGEIDPAALKSLESDLIPLLNQPGLYVVIGLLFCLVVPIIEELFKPLAVWAFAGKNITPAEGWAAGMLCGAAFGLLESLSMINVASGDLWLTTAIGRVGTGLLHVFTAGISGYVLAKTWQDRNYLRLSLVYLGVIVLHGSWNFFALLMGVSHLAMPISVPAISGLMAISTWVLAGLAVLMAAGIWIINYRLRKKSLPPEVPPSFAQPEQVNL
jgi:hypothetical protein